MIARTMELTPNISPQNSVKIIIYNEYYDKRDRIMSNCGLEEAENCVFDKVKLCRDFRKT